MATTPPRQHQAHTRACGRCLPDTSSLPGERRHLSSSQLELIALLLSLEVKLSKVRVVGALGSPHSLEVKESRATEVNLAWVVNKHGNNEFLSTAAA